MYGYVYLTTNLITGDKYIGQHKSRNFDLNYHGSGKHLKSAIKLYGSENFVTEVLKWCDSKESLNEEEIRYISDYNAVERDDFYNIAKGGSFGFDASMLSEESRKSIGIKNRKHLSERNREKTGVFKHKESSKRKIQETCLSKRDIFSASQKGRIRMKNVDSGICVSIYPEEVSKYEELSYVKGVFHNGAGHNRGEVGKRKWVKKESTNESKQILVEELKKYLDDGFVPGRIL